jgi:5,10-methylenetetrahydrofolate reductase
MTSSFDVIWEIDTPEGVDRSRLHRQIDVAADLAAAILVPENHTGRATVSSLAIAGEVRHRGVPAIACLNARDRNLLGLRRDLLTATFCGIDDVLLVYGDEPDVGERASGLTVRWMLEECRTTLTPMTVAVTSRLVRVPAWKLGADRIFVQVAYSVDELMRWRETVDFAGEIYAGVMVIPSAAMARRLGERIPQLRVPQRWIDAVEADPAAGVDMAAQLVDDIRESGGFDGVHVIAGTRQAELAGALQDVLRPAATASLRRSA